MTVTVTPKNAPTEAEFYAIICDALGHKGHFGNNLDALYDLLTQPTKPFRIYIKDADFSKRYEGRGEAILQVLKDARLNGGCFSLKVRTLKHR